MAADIPSRCLLLLSISGLATAGWFSFPRFGGSWLGRLEIPKFEYKAELPKFEYKPELPKFEFKPEITELKTFKFDDFKKYLYKFKMPETKFNPIPKEEGTNIFNPLLKDEGTNKFNPIPPNDGELHSVLDEQDKTKEKIEPLKPKDDENVRPSKTNEDEMKNKKTEKIDDDDDGDGDDHHHHHHHPHHDDHHHHHDHHNDSNHEHPDANQGGDFRERVFDDDDTSASTAGTTTHVINGSGNSSAKYHFANIASRRAIIWTIAFVALGCILILAVGGYLYKRRKKARHMDDEFGLLQ